jgi:hypothetical protein
MFFFFSNKRVDDIFMPLSRKTIVKKVRCAGLVFLVYEPWVFFLVGLGARALFSLTKVPRAFFLLGQERKLLILWPIHSLFPYIFIFYFFMFWVKYILKKYLTWYLNYYLVLTWLLNNIISFNWNVNNFLFNYYESNM